MGSGCVGPRDPVVPPPDLPEEIGREVVLGALRVLGLARFYQPGGRADRDADGNPPQALQDWLKAVADRWGQEPAALMDWARERLPHAGQVCQRWVVRLDRCQIAQPPEDVWRLRALRLAARARQRRRLPALPSPTSAREPNAQGERPRRLLRGDGPRAAAPVTRLHTEELTGQTERADAASRQARFQGIFLGGEAEPPLPSGIDVLSVTTTMEAGVDIGSLLAVLMANVPPRRFNYQQRVGRAGRRGDPLSVALTVARERSHDHYYFQNPELITSEPPPPPYLASDREQIIRRVVVSEALRRAFDRVRDTDPNFEPGYNVHGHFGAAPGLAAAPPRRRDAFIAGDRDDLTDSPRRC